MGVRSGRRLDTRALSDVVDAVVNEIVEARILNQISKFSKYSSPLQNSIFWSILSFHFRENGARTEKEYWILGERAWASQSEYIILFDFFFIYLALMDSFLFKGSDTAVSIWYIKMTCAFRTSRPTHQAKEWLSSGFTRFTLSLSRSGSKPEFTNTQ